MRNKILFSTAIAATISALAADAKTVVTPVARMLNPATYYSANTLVVPGGAANTSDLLSLICPGIRGVDREVAKPAFQYLPDIRAFSNVINRENSPAHPGRDVAESPCPTSDIAVSDPPQEERTRSKHFTRRSVIKENVSSLDDFVRRQRESHRKQLASLRKRRIPGRQFVLPLDHNSVRVCIAARPARVPLAGHRLLPRHVVASKYAMPLTKADVERKNEHAKEYRLAYARKSRHLRKLSPETIAKFKFYPPLRRFDTDVLVAATPPEQPIIVYVPVPVEERVLYSAAPAAGVQKTIAIAATATDDVIGLPSHKFTVSDIVMNGNMPSKTGINGMFYTQAAFAAVNIKAHNGLFDLPVALHNIPRGGLHQVTYDELGHSPPACRA